MKLEIAFGDALPIVLRHRRGQMRRQHRRNERIAVTVEFPTSFVEHAAPPHTLRMSGTVSRAAIVPDGSQGLELLAGKL